MRIENVFISDKNELKINDKWYFEKKFIRNSVRKGDKLMMMMKQSDLVIRLILFDLKTYFRYRDLKSLNTKEFSIKSHTIDTSWIAENYYR